MEGICGWTAPQQGTAFRTLAPPRKLSLYRIAHAIQSTRFATGGDLGRFGVFDGFAPPYCHGCGNVSAIAGNARRDLFMASSSQSDSGHFR